MEVERSEAAYTPEYQRFALASSSVEYNRQFSHLYMNRIKCLRPLVTQAAQEKWRGKDGGAWTRLRPAGVHAPPPPSLLPPVRGLITTDPGTPKTPPHAPSPYLPLFPQRRPK